MPALAPRRANVRTAHGVDYCGSRHPVLKKLHADIPPVFHGGQLWRSSFMVMEFLLEHPLSPRSRVIEVGCGWGLLGIFCAKTFGCEVVLTDKDARVFPYVDAHLDLNGISLETAERDFRDFRPEHFGGFDVMLGSDICFWPEHVGILKKLIGQALAAGVQTIIIADPGRYTFKQVTRHCEQHYHCKLLKRETQDKKTSGYLLVISNNNNNNAATSVTE